MAGEGEDDEGRGESKTVGSPCLPCLCVCRNSPSLFIYPIINSMKSGRGHTRLPFTSSSVVSNYNPCHIAECISEFRGEDSACDCGL